MSDKTEYVVVGLNSIGRTLAGLLAFGESGTLTLVDDQKVNDKSVPQGYMAVDLGLHKTDAVEATLRETSSFLDIRKYSRLDGELVDRLVSKISGDTVVFYCETLSSNGRLHAYEDLKNCCKEIYFFGFHEDGSAQFYRATGNMNLQGKHLDKVPDGKENCIEGKKAAARAFGMHVREKHVITVEV